MPPTIAPVTPPTTAPTGPPTIAPPTAPAVAPAAVPAPLFCAKAAAGARTASIAPARRIFFDMSVSSSEIEDSTARPHASSQQGNIGAFASSGRAKRVMLAQEPTENGRFEPDET